ncbi:hypothetical protein B296_00017296, partial [Ensete ventricosum]
RVDARHLFALLRRRRVPPGELRRPPTHLSGLDTHNPIPPPRFLLSLSPPSLSPAPLLGSKCWGLHPDSEIQEEESRHDRGELGVS